MAIAIKQTDVNRYIKKQYGSVNDARKAFGVSSAAQARAMAAKELAQRTGKSAENVVNYYTERREEKAKEALRQASESQVRAQDVPIGVYDVDRQQSRMAGDYEAQGVRDRFQQASYEQGTPQSYEEQRRAALAEEGVKRVYFAAGGEPQIIGSDVVQRKEAVVQNLAPMSPALALAVSGIEQSKSQSQYPNIDRSLRYLSLVQQEPSQRLFFGSKEGRSYLLANAPEFAKQFGSEVEREIFVRAGDEPKSNKIRDMIATAKSERKELEAIRVEQGLSKEEFKDIRAKGRKEEEVRLGKEIFKDIGNFGELVKAGAEPYTTKEGIFRQVKEGIRDNIPIFGEPIKLVETGASLAMLKNKEKIVVQTDVDLESARRGAGMVAYTGASLLQNVPAFGAKAPEVAQTIDVGLAVPTYTKAILSPTPKNIGAAKIEVYDVAVDFVPEVVGVLWMGAAGLAAGPKGALQGGLRGYQTGRKVPTPNINTNVKINQEANVAIAEIPLPVDSSFSYVSELPVSYDFEGYATRLEGGAAVSEDLNVNLPRVNINQNSFVEIPVTENVNAFAGVEIGQKVNENLNVNENINKNLNINENANKNLNINENVNENVNKNLNINENIYANINQNVNTNFNVNANLWTTTFDRRPVGGLYQAFAKVGKEFKPIGQASSFERAVREGFQYTGETPKRTFGVKKVGEEGFINIGNLQGYTRRQTKQGFVFVEPSSKAINTFGELKGITAKGIAASRGKKRRFV